MHNQHNDLEAEANHAELEGKSRSTRGHTKHLTEGYYDEACLSCVTEAEAEAGR
jgi:hypothetical protein